MNCLVRVLLGNEMNKARKSFDYGIRAGQRHRLNFISGRLEMFQNICGRRKFNAVTGFLTYRKLFSNMNVFIRSIHFALVSSRAALVVFVIFSAVQREVRHEPAGLPSSLRDGWSMLQRFEHS